jgi:hypothetical protein
MRILTCLVATLALACGGVNHASDGGGDVAEARDPTEVPVADRAPSADEAGALDGDVVPSPAKLTVTPTRIRIRTNTNNVRSGSAAIQNAGDSPTGPLVASFIGTDADTFGVMWLRGQEGLAPGEKGDFAITYDTSALTVDPVHGATLTATLVIADSGPGGSVAAVDVSIVIIVASRGLAIVGPPEMGTVALGTTGASLSFMVLNLDILSSGPLALSVSSTELSIADDTCTGTSLPPAEMCWFSLRFSPTAVGARWAILTAQGTEGDMVASQFISGMGVEP